MNTKQKRADFEAWYEKQKGEDPRIAEDMYTPFATACWEAYKAGRAALQAQLKNDTTLFCDLKTDEEKSAFFLTGRGYETGVIAQAIQNDVAMAYHRCSEYRKELEALQSQDREEWMRRFIELVDGFEDEAMLYGHPREADRSDMDKARAALIDHARRIEGEGE